MSDRRKKIPVYLDSGKIKSLTDEEIRIILRGADELIMKAGRTMLAKLLKGSKEKKILEYQLDKCPVYGALSNFSSEEITHKIDWMIEHDYLALEYSGKLPFLVFTPKGWEIEKETYTEELFCQFKKLCEDKSANVEQQYCIFIGILKTRNRQVILLLLDKIEQRGTKDFLPLLEQWAITEVKKVAARIHFVEKRISDVNP